MLEKFSGKFFIRDFPTEFPTREVPSQIFLQEKSIRNFFSRGIPMEIPPVEIPEKSMQQKSIR